MTEVCTTSWCKAAYSIRHLVSGLLVPSRNYSINSKHAGVIRADAEATDIGAFLVMMRTVIDMSVDPAPDLWKRYLTFFLDALRATDRPSIATPALTPNQFDHII